MTCINRSIPKVFHTSPNIWIHHVLRQRLFVLHKAEKSAGQGYLRSEKTHKQPDETNVEQHLLLARFTEVRKDTLETQRLGDQIKRELVPWCKSVGQPWPRVEDRKVTPPRTTVARTNTLNRMCMMMHLCCIRPISITRQCNSTMNCNHLSIPLQIATVGTMSRIRFEDLKKV